MSSGDNCVIGALIGLYINCLLDIFLGTGNSGVLQRFRKRNSGVFSMTSLIMTYLNRTLSFSLFGIVVSFVCLIGLIAIQGLRSETQMKTKNLEKK